MANLFAKLAPISAVVYFSAGHRPDPKGPGRGVDRFDVGLPASELVFGVIEHLASFFAVLERLVGIARDNRRVIEEVEHAARLLGEDDLLFGALDGGRKVDVVGFLELLARLNQSARLSGLCCP